MAMQTVIMAGGEGVRLRPLTQNTPKPLSPLCGEALMGYTLKLLQRHGIDSATATLWYRPDDVMREFGLMRHGVKLRYSTEESPLGTAGSVLKAVGDARDTTLVLSGDGLTACDLTQAYAFHRAQGAAATLVLTQVDIPLAYGVVVTQADGRIVRFVEKPDWSRVVGRLINTGIYFLEPEALQLIPKDAPYDFGRQLFPRMLQLGFPVYGYVSEEYWCDVGDPAAFLRAQGDLLTGRAGLSAVNMGIRTLKDGYISFDSYVDPRAHVAPDAIIRNSCVLAGARVESGVQMTGTILCPGAQAGRGSVLTAGSVLGSGARLEAFSHCEGGRLWSGVKTLPGTVVRTVVRKENQTLGVREGRIACAEPAQITHLAGALIQTLRADQLVVMREDDASAVHALWLGALASYGVKRVWDADCGTLGMLSNAIRNKAADGGVLVSQGGAVLLDGRGFCLSDSASAQLQMAWQRLETPCVHAQKHAICRDTMQRGLYIKTLTGKFRVVRGLCVVLQCEAGFVRDLIQDTLWQAGHTVTEVGEVHLRVQNGGYRLKVGEKKLTRQEEWLICAQSLRNQGAAIYDIPGFGAAVDGMLLPDESEDCQAQRTIMEDDLARVLCILQHFSRETSERVMRSLPAITQKKLEIPCEERDKSRVLAALLEDAAPCAQGGLERIENEARAHISPDPVLPLLRVTTYARSAENAQELCDFLDQRIRSALLYKGKNGSGRMQ